MPRRPSLSITSILNRQPLSETSTTPVTIYNPQNVYVYSSQNLWIAYGLAIAAASLATISGFVAVLINGKSFSVSFSSILRITRSPELAEIMAAKDTAGVEPLPKYLSRVNLSMQTVPRNGNAAYRSHVSGGKHGKKTYGSLLPTEDSNTSVGDPENTEEALVRR